MRAPLVCLVLLIVPLAGCTGGSDADGGDATDPAGQGGSGGTGGGPGGSGGGSGGSGGGGGNGGGGPDDGTEYIDGADGSYACARPGTNVKVDPNRTYEGGAHSHDEWGGKDQMVVFEKNTPAGFVDTKDMVIHPGTGRVDFKLTWTDQVAARPETRTLNWDKPGDGAAMQSHIFSTKGSNHSIEVNLSHNDPPHYKRTLWSLKLDGGAAHLTVTIFRGYDCLPIDPPHYDYWNGATQKVLSTTVIRVAEESVAVCVVPADLCSGLRQPGSGAHGLVGDNTSVPPGTKRVEVVVSWRNDYNQYPTRIRFEYQTASTNGGSTSAAAYWKQPPPPTASSSTSQTFEVTVGAEDWDSPYDTKSAWRFKHYFDSTSTNPLLGSSGMFKGEITFVFTAYRT